MFRYSMRPTGIENVWSESMNSISDPAATTGCCGLSSKKYRSDAKALGAAWISSRKRMLRSDSGVSDTAADEVQDRAGVVARECLSQMRMPFEVDGYEVTVGLGLAEQRDQRGLADLPCTPQDQRLAPGAMQPVLDVAQLMSIHGERVVLYTHEFQFCLWFYGYVFMRRPSIRHRIVEFACCIVTRYILAVFDITRTRNDCFMNTRPQESTHPGLYVREHVLPRGLTVTEAAKRMNVGRPALSNFLNGRAALSPAMAVRLERTFGADREALLDLQTRFDAREAPGGRRAITAATYAPTVLAVKARDIAAWASSGIEPRHKLAEFIRRLVNSTGRDLSKVDFPANDHAERRGWDGEVIASAPTPWIPEGESGWEVSCNARPSDKANDDFARRTRSVPPRERRARTFVFATPRDWPGKSAWVDEKARLGVWNAVRAYDASDLEQWIEQSVPVQIWFAERLGRPVDGYRSLSRFWTEWASAAEPALVAATLRACGRTQFRAVPRMARGITRPSVHHCGGFEGRGHRLPWPASWAGMVATMGPTIGESSSTNPMRCIDWLPLRPAHSWRLRGTREVEKALSGLRRNIHCVLPRPRNSVDLTSPPVDVVLDLPGHEYFRNALEAMGIRRGRADRLAVESARSPTILRRRLSVVPADLEPDWGRDREVAGKVIPAAMIGAWHAASRADREIVSLLADADYEHVESGVAELLRLDDPPVWSIGQYRGVVSRLDALFATAPFITEADLDRLFLVAEYVLSESDPALELPERRAMDGGCLREAAGPLQRAPTRDWGDVDSAVGIRRPAVRQASWGQCRWPGSPISSASCYPRSTPTNCCPSRANFLLWPRRRPGRFLEVFEEDLQGDEPGLLELMKPVDSGMFGTGRSRTGILSALECLAWCPTHFPRVVEILARLSYRKIDDNRSATPKNTLRSLFRFWMPDTDAAIDQRMRALDGLVARHPEIGWWISLCVARRPRAYGIISRCYRPRWRGGPVTLGATDHAQPWSSTCPEGAPTSA